MAKLVQLSITTVQLSKQDCNGEGEVRNKYCMKKKSKSQTRINANLQQYFLQQRRGSQQILHEETRQITKDLHSNLQQYFLWLHSDEIFPSLPSCYTSTHTSDSPASHFVAFSIGEIKNLPIPDKQSSQFVSFGDKKNTSIVLY